MDSTVAMKGYVCLVSRQTVRRNMGTATVEIMPLKQNRTGQQVERGKFAVRAHVVRGQRGTMRGLLQLRSLMWLSLRQSPDEEFHLPPHQHDSLDCWLSQWCCLGVQEVHAFSSQLFFPES